MKGVDLSLAYDRAGMTFKGQLRQNFIVLNDKGVKRGGRDVGGGGGGGPPTLTGGNKRVWKMEKVWVITPKGN